MNDVNRKWYAYYTKPKHEFKALEQLNNICGETFLPAIIVKKRWADRWKNINEPLFKGYIFVKVTEKERLLGLQQKAIINTVSFSGLPAAIPDYQIENLKKMLNSNKEIFVEDKIIEGKKIIVTGGPFDGIEGVVYSVSGNDNMLAVTIDLLQRSVIVKLPIANIKVK